MLILARNYGQRLVINGNIIIEVLPPNDRLSARKGARLGITAPQDVIVDREEVHEQRQLNPRPGSLVEVRNEKGEGGGPAARTSHLAPLTSPP